jgi:YHS domain-containing protein
MLAFIFAALSIVRRLLGAFTPAGQVQEQSVAGHLVKDPVCGTYVPEATALKHGEHSFCSEACRQKFQLTSMRIP